MKPAARPMTAVRRSAGGARGALSLALALGIVAGAAEWTRHSGWRAPAGAASGRAGDELDGLLGGRRMDLRRVDRAALSAVPGLGPERSRRLLAARARGELEGWSDALAVPGLGPKTVETLGRYADISPAPR